MQLRPVTFVLAMALVGSGASAEVVRVADLNTRQIRALDRDRTVVFLQGGLQRTRNFSGRVASEDWLFRKVYRRDASGWRVISYHAWESPR
jgi:hypothetical protein